ncbi:LemA family protein [Nitrincola alkalilacustris]|uniref:LemA family protein n=1 Tax=Nitrincola alkalilacustris TaxID=1571224 RepID=UPI00124DA690|nr:LemA family protein [Nitrincola alkalilacustris]
MIKKLFLALLATLLLVVGYWLLSLGFGSLNQFRQIERLPSVPIVAALPGEVNLNGVAQPTSDRAFITSPDTGTLSLYFRYHIEREERDSDGDTSWRTVSNQIESLPFLLQDNSAQILIDATGMSASLPISHRRTQGDMRYTEYRIEPGHSLFILGYLLEAEVGEPRVVFNHPGHYTPMISAFGEAHERSEIAFLSLVMILVGIAAAAISVYLFCLLLRVHKTAVLLSLQTLVLMLMLAYQGFNMAQQDVEEAVQNLERAEQRGLVAIQVILDDAGISWQGDWSKLPPAERLGSLNEQQLQRLLGIRHFLLSSHWRTDRLLSAWPERLFAAQYQLPSLMPTADEKQVQQQQRVDFTSTRLQGWQSVFLVGIGLGLLWLPARFGYRRVKLKRLIENLPTTPLNGIAYGLTEVVGFAQLPTGRELLKGPLTGRDCLGYLYRVEERRSSGKKEKWVTIQYDAELHPLWLTEEEGKAHVEILPRSSEIIMRKPVSKIEGNHRYTETVIEPGAELYVLGPALVAEERAELQIRAGEEQEPFIISDLSEQEVMLMKVQGGFAWLTASLIGGVMLALGLAGTWGSFGALPWLLCAMMPLFYLLTALGILMYNDLVFLRQRARKTLANIEVSLKKRSDLIPALEKVAKTYLQHEQSVQSELAQLRTQLGKSAWSTEESNAFLQAETSLHAMLLARVEAYPDLKADETLRQLMHSLTRMEDEVSLMRVGHTLAIERYNTRRQQFPEVILAGAFGFGPLQSG